jgi:hypothetical protein
VLAEPAFKIGKYHPWQKLLAVKSFGLKKSFFGHIIKNAEIFLITKTLKYFFYFKLKILEQG